MSLNVTKCTLVSTFTTEIKYYRLKQWIPSGISKSNFRLYLILPVSSIALIAHVHIDPVGIVFNYLHDSLSVFIVHH